MSMPPQPPRPPAPPMPPVPPRSGTNIVLIVVLILGIIVAGAIFAVWMGLRVISHNVHVSVSDGLNGKKEVSIQTPAGNVEVRKDVGITEARLGLPIYPGATPVDKDDSAAVSIGVPGHEHVGVVAGKFETSDPLEKVRDFYNHRLSGEVTKFTERNSEGKMVFEIKHGNLERIVALHEEDGKTRIELVRVGESSGETN
ncbi:MAG: hypothetical protein ACRD3T_03355 [Terriglobia bacterium]